MFDLNENVNLLGMPNNLLCLFNNTGNVSVIIIPYIKHCVII